VLAVLGDDALGAEPAGVREDSRTVALKVLGVVDPCWRLLWELSEPRLALLERPGSPVLSVELEQVEGIEDADLTVKGGEADDTVSPDAPREPVSLSPSPAPSVAALIRSISRHQNQ
jgi:hypothetical protein